MELISRWEDFGMKYQGLWKSDTIYQKNDVVSFYINGQEGHFLCNSEHISEIAPFKDQENWREWDTKARLMKKVYPHNLLNSFMNHLE